MTLGIVAESDLAGNTTSEHIFFDGSRVPQAFSGFFCPSQYRWVPHSLQLKRAQHA